MSPEQVRGENLDARSDVFSMGIVLAEMLMARRLFSAANDVETLLMVRRGDLTRLDKHGTHIPRQLDSIIRKALAVDLDQRYASAAEFGDVLADYLASSSQRTGASHLAEVVADLQRDGVGTPVPRTSITISGTQTVVERRAASNAAEIGRIAFARSAAAPKDRPRGMEPAPRPRAATALPEGVLSPGRVVDLLCSIARNRRTGVLVLQHGDLHKEAYFHEGNPVFVSSNVTEDMFGEFLVRRGVISREQLERVLHVLDKFQGRMGQALVSLGILEPVDAVRLLAAQVATKLVTSCAWAEGNYMFRADERNPWPALELQLRTFAIVGSAITSLPVDRLVKWITWVGARSAVVNLGRVHEFGLDATSIDRFAIFGDGFRAVRDLVDACPTPSERLHVTAIAYILWRCGLLRFAPAA
jgi:serine/threonine-protein kinase